MRPTEAQTAAPQAAAQTMPFWRRLGEGIRMELVRQRRSQSELAELLGRSRNYVTLRVNGRASFKLNEVEAAAEFLGKDLETLAALGAEVAD